MDIDNLKHVVGKAETAKPAIIRFFGCVDSYATEKFNEEFLWLQDVVKPSKIVVLVNSEGGSVVYGMSTYSIIQSCPIEVDCVIEGIAASMGSVIWAAGKHLYMHDYSILMIHNPFVAGAESDDENTKAMVKAFRNQLETIYRRRFGLTKEAVQEIMDGAENVDGTYLSAKEAVERGIIAKENVLKTPKTVKDEIDGRLDGLSDASAIRDVMSSIAGDDMDKLAGKVSAILEQKEKEPTNHNKMEKNENPLFGAVAAQLGFSENPQLASVTNRITELVKAETELKDIRSKFEALQIKFTGKETEVTNLTEELNGVKAQVKQYKDAEAAAHKAKITALIDKAVADGRIKAEVKDQWTKMAEADFDTVKDTLDSIPVRKQITAEIAKDAENQKDAKEGKTQAERELEEKIKAAVGADFQFKKLDD